MDPRGAVRPLAPASFPEPGPSPDPEFDLESGLEHGSPADPGPETASGPPDVPMDGPEDVPVEGQTAASEAMPDAAPSPVACGPTAADADLESLRNLLFQREIELLEQLKARLDDPQARARDISSVVAEALLLRAHKDDRLNVALEPVVEQILQVSLRKHPHRFTNLLFPLMGPAIRRSIAETFRSMMHSFNKSIEMSFSWKGLRWRLEALRSGKPFSEIVLLHTIVYRVEQVFLIHSETGLEIAHVANEEAEAQDASMVSAMLTAIQDFVRDCFTGAQSGDLESLQHGDFTFIVEKDERAYLACQIRGTPPSGFRSRVQATLENILIEFTEPLEGFSGDTDPFAGAERHLESLLDSRFVDEDKPLPVWIRAMPLLLLIGLVALGGWWGYRSHQEGLELERAQERRLAFRHRMRASLDHLRREPGLIVTQVVQREDEPWDVVVLKDDLAPAPERLLTEQGIDASEFSFTVVPHVSYEKSIVASRVASKIHPPDSVQMRFGEDGTLHFSGTAPMEWMLRARQEALALPGVEGIDMKEVVDPRMEQLTAMVKAVEGTIVHFGTGRDVPVAEDLPKLVQAVDTLVALEKLASGMGMAVSLTVYGHADATGQDKRNYEISQSRARTIAAMLYGKGSSLPIALYGMGAEYAERGENGKSAANQDSRRIEFKVHLAKAGEPTSDILEK